MDFPDQAMTFVVIVITGMVLGVIFDFYRVLRGVFKPRALVTYLFDGLYWIFAIGLAFLALLLSNWGELRFYVFLALFLGAVLYYRFVSRLAILGLLRLLRCIHWFAGWLHKIMLFLIVKPVMYVCTLLGMPFFYAFRKSRQAKRKTMAWWRSRKPPPPPPENTIPPQ